MNRTPMKPPTKPMKRSPMRASSAPMNRAGMETLRARQKLAPDQRPKKMKTKQRAVTRAEKSYHDLLAKLGCIACLIDGRFNDYVSIHHVDGRTKPGCHGKVLPLCAEHHQQDDTDPLQRVAVHPWSAQFEAIYGSQEWLMGYANALLARMGKGVAA